MYVARLVCSDVACAEERTVEAATLPELELLACACGCSFAVIGWPDWSDEASAEAVVVRLGRRRPRGDGPLRHAA